MDMERFRTGKKTSWTRTQQIQFSSVPGNSVEHFLLEYLYILHSQLVQLYCRALPFYNEVTTPYNALINL